MIRSTDLLGASTAPITFTQPVWTGEVRQGSSWFEIDAHGTTIAGDVGPSARGLSIDAHTERVLVHLLGERDAPL